MIKIDLKLNLTENEIQVVSNKINDVITEWKGYHRKQKKGNKSCVVSLDETPFETGNSCFVFCGSGKFGKQQDLWLSDKGEFYFKIDNNKVQQFWNPYHILDKEFLADAFAWYVLEYYENGSIDTDKIVDDLDDRACMEALRKEAMRFARKSSAKHGERIKC